MLLRPPLCVSIWCAADPFAIQQMCLRWLHSILHPQPITVTLHLPAARHHKRAPTASASTQPSASPEAPQVSDFPDAMQPRLDHHDSPTAQAQELSLTPQTITCKVVSEVMQLSSLITQPTICCHCDQPVKGTSSNPGGHLHRSEASRHKEAIQELSTLQVSHLTQCMHGV